MTTERSKKFSVSARNYTIGLIVSAFIAASIGGYLWQSSIELERRIEHQTSHKAANHADAANIAIENKCSDVPASELYECVAKERDNADNRQGNEYNLEAQQVMTVWTRSMGQAAIIAMMVGFLGLGLIFVTFRETRRAADSATKTHNAYIAAERAKLIFSVENPRYEKRDSGLLMVVDIRVSNIGRTAAHVDIGMARFSKNQDWDGAGGWHGFFEGKVIEPNKNALSRDAIPYSLGERYVFGECEYSSPFGNHTTYFSFSINTPPNKTSARKVGQPLYVSRHYPASMPNDT